jgi:nitroreductase
MGCVITTQTNASAVWRTTRSCPCSSGGSETAKRSVRHDLAVRSYEKSRFIYNALRRSPNAYHNGRAMAYKNSFPKAIGERKMDQPRSERAATHRRPNGYADPSALVAFLKSLRTVRYFEQNKPVPENVLQDVLEVARWSGSARNRQPWEFVMVRDRKTLEGLAACEGRATHLANAAVGIVLVMAGEPEFFEQETFDEGRLSERISLTAASYGVASSVGWFKGQGRQKPKEILGIPHSKLVRTVLSLGYPTSVPEGGHLALPKGRKRLLELVHEERYGRRGGFRRENRRRWC